MTTFTHLLEGGLLLDCYIDGHGQYGEPNVIIENDNFNLGELGQIAACPNLTDELLEKAKQLEADNAPCGETPYTQETHGTWNHAQLGLN